MNPSIENTRKFVQSRLQNAEGGHDWFHIHRVYKTALYIAKEEGNVNLEVVALAALLHDIADSKFHNGDEEIGPGIAREFLRTQNLDEAHIDHILQIIRSVSFKGGHNDTGFHSRELEVVQDADRLDAIGAIGIARTFNYGGFKNRTLYNPEIPPNPGLSKEEYKNSTAPTINHFYEKLLLLKDRMNTDTARKIASKRHEFMEKFLEEFYEEWNAEFSD